MPVPVIDFNLCTGTGDCITACSAAFEWDPQNPGRPRVVAGANSDDIACIAVAINQCPQGAIYLP